MTRLLAAAGFFVFCVGSSFVAQAQLDKLEAFTQLDKKLPPEVWDGKTLHVSTYEELQEVRAFLTEYGRVTTEGKEALANVSEAERTDERRDKLNGYINWKNDVTDAFNLKYEELKPEKLAVFTGPDAGKQLGPPEKCKPGLIRNFPLAVFQCEAGRNPDYGKIYSAPGGIELKLTYRRVVEGKESKNSETLSLRLVKETWVNSPPQWAVD